MPRWILVAYRPLIIWGKDVLTNLSHISEICRKVTKKMRLRQLLNGKSVVISTKKRDCDRFLCVIVLWMMSRLPTLVQAPEWQSSSLGAYFLGKWYSSVEKTIKNKVALLVSNYFWLYLQNICKNIHRLSVYLCYLIMDIFMPSNKIRTNKSTINNYNYLWIIYIERSSW